MNPRTQSTGLAWLSLATALLMVLLLGEVLFGSLFAAAGFTWLGYLAWQDERERRLRRMQREDRLRARAEAAYRERNGTHTDEPEAA